MVVTDRLDLVPATIPALRAALEGTQTLAAILDGHVPPTWPPEYLDARAVQFSLDRLTEDPALLGWWMYFVILPRGPVGRTLIGSAGYKGPPLADGTVEVGYGIVSDQRRQGYATEVTRALVARAFALPAVHRVIAETLPELVPSIGVLRKCGFRFTGDGSEPGVIRFELTRDAYGRGVA